MHRLFVDNVITRDIKLDPKSWIIFKKYDVNAVSPIAIFENQWPVNKVYLQTWNLKHMYLHTRLSTLSTYRKFGSTLMLSANHSIQSCISRLNWTGRIRAV